MFFPAALALFAAAGASAKVIDVTVGGANLTFSPEAVFADIGDQLVFHFQPKNHTVTQVSFADPCSPTPGGFDSGFMPVAANTTGGTFTVTVNDTKPIWVMCKQAMNTANSHCGAGMIFSANCPADPAPNSFDNFKKAALAIGTQLKAAAAAASSAAPAAPTQNAAAPSAAAVNSAYPGSWSTMTIDGATVTMPPAPAVATVTATVTGASATWTTTYASFPNSPAPTPNAAPNVTVVQVGANNQLVFDPPHVSAAIGDIISFQFVSKNHSVVQSTFASPCVKALDNQTGMPLFATAFQPGVSATNVSTVNYTVNSTAPLWFYCSQRSPADHCGMGMVFAINTDESGPHNFSTFQSIAVQMNGTNSSSSASASPSGTGAAASPSPSNGAGATRLGAGALLGAVAFVFAALL